MTGALQAHEIQISRDGKGRWVDNIFDERFWRSVKYGTVYLKAYDGMADVKRSLKQYFEFYNRERRHQSLDGRTPDQVYDEPSERLAA